MQRWAASEESALSAGQARKKTPSTADPQEKKVKQPSVEDRGGRVVCGRCKHMGNGSLGHSASSVFKF